MLVIHQLKTLKDIFRARRQAAGAAAVLRLKSAYGRCGPQLIKSSVMKVTRLGCSLLFTVLYLFCSL